MSEPLSTTEIEDVLSSIRRLVAEDLRPQPVAQPKSQAAALRAPSVAAKLILTPALRIVANEDNVPTSSGVSAVISTVGTGLAPADWEPETEDTSDIDAPLSDDIGLEAADHGWSFEAEADNDDDADDVQVAQSVLPPPEMDAETGFEPVSELSRDSVETAPVFVSVRHSGSMEDLPAWAQSEEPQALETEEILPEPATGTIEPDPEWADAAEADVLAELAEEQVLEPQGYIGDASFVEAGFDRDQDEASDFDEDEPHYDEVLLREIVRDLLREELQGTTGERITRNIRKLVRAEIARALAIQDLT